MQCFNNIVLTHALYLFLYRYVFIQEVKSIMLKGQLPVGNQDAGKIGALLAQVEFGDASDQVCYPRYFKEWNPGISREILKYHVSLKGKIKLTVILLYNAGFQS